jgi:predicted Zn-dependent protease
MLGRNRALMNKLLITILFFYIQSAFSEPEKTPTLISDKKVSDIGIQTYKENLKKITLSDDEILNTRVNCIGKLLTNHATNIPEGTDWEFVVPFDMRPDAYSFAGGKIVVNAGLLLVLDDNDMLAAALANPISGILLRQPNKRISRVFLATQFEKKTIKEALESEEKYNLANAMEADNEAYKLLIKSGFNPEAMLKAVLLLQSLQIKNDADFDNQRVKNIEKLLATKSTSSSPSSANLVCPNGANLKP